MSKTNVVSPKNNAIQFSYFSNEPGSDWVPFNKTDGIFYKPTFVKYPYLAQDGDLIALDNKEQIDIHPFDFILHNQGERAFANQTPHDFVISEDLLEFTSGTPILEIRTKNSSGEWQRWQAIVGPFNLYRILDIGSKQYLRGPIEDEFETFKNLFEIRFGGLLSISFFNDVQIISDDKLMKTFNTNTRQIEFFPDSDNPCWSFEDRCENWRNFIDKYHSYDSNGNRI